MSLRGRYVIDRIKQMLGTNRFRLPVPPYGDVDYWDAAYRSFGPEDSFEWGDVDLHADLLDYSHRPIDFDARGSPNVAETPVQGSLAEAMGIPAHAAEDEPIMLLGCGNSKLGEHMIGQGWRGPILQVDVSQRILECMSLRCASYIENGHMNFIQDDATELSAFRNGMVHACLDKGLMDALYCADEYDQCQRILKSVHRVMKPGGSFCFFSFSRPEFLLPHIMQDTTRHWTQWQDVQVQELSKILLYKFQKKADDDDPLRQMKVKVKLNPNKKRASSSHRKGGKR